MLSRTASASSEVAAPKISVLIANYNGGELFGLCLRTLFENPPRDQWEVIVVDNASSDGSADRAAAAYPAIQMIRNATNVGLAKAFNQALFAASGKYLMCLDNDTTVLPGSLDALCDYLESHPGTAIAGSRLFNPDMSQQHTARRFPHPLNALFGRRSILTKLFPTNPISQRYLMSELEKTDDPYEVDWVSTAALMARRSAIEQAGALDEDFFVYWVDAEWCHRFKRHGWNIACVPASRIIHNENLKAGRRDRRRAKMIVDFHRGVWTYYRKHCLSHWYSPMGLFTIFALSLRAALLIAADDMKRFYRNLSRANHVQSTSGEQTK